MIDQIIRAAESNRVHLMHAHDWKVKRMLPYDRRFSLTAFDFPTASLLELSLCHAGESIIDALEIEEYTSSHAYAAVFYSEFDGGARYWCAEVQSEQADGLIEGIGTVGAVFRSASKHRVLTMLGDCMEIIDRSSP